MLSNAYFLEKFRFDTAENEPSKNLQKFANFPNFANPNPYLCCHDRRRTRRRGQAHARGRPSGDSKRERARAATLQDRREAGRPGLHRDRQDHPVDGKMLLVFGCIGTDFCKKIRVLQHFSKSTRLSI